MPVLSDARHERFAQLIAEKRMSNAAAYRQAVGKPDANNKVASSMADKWLNAVGISSRIAELKAEAAKSCAMTRERYVEKLTAMLEGAPGEASLDNKLCDSLISRGVRHAVFPMKVQVAAQLAKVCGWEKPTEVKLDVSDKLSGLLDRIFGSPDKD
jgi:hypothetical protein